LVFHLGPSVRCELEGSLALLLWISGGQERRATVRLPAELAWRAAQGLLEPRAGWYSPGFGQLVPTVTLIGVGHGRTAGPLSTLVTIDTFTDELAVEDLLGSKASHL
jgi:hypothetical protein